MAGCPPTAAEMAQIRADVAAIVFDTSCTIKRPVKTPDGRMTNTEVDTTIATVNVGIKSPTVSQATLYAGLIGSQIAWMVSMPYGTDCTSGDHLYTSSNRMIVQADLSPQSYSSMNTVLAVEIE